MTKLTFRQIRRLQLTIKFAAFVIALLVFMKVSLDCRTFGGIFRHINTKQAVITSNQTSHDNYQATNLSDIHRSIERYNEFQTIINEEVFGPLMNNSVIIVVQVHKRITYLRHLIVSLAQARDISNTLLIFSHDFYDEEINELVQSIDFCKVMQIFYPFAIQMHPNEFPGTDPKDCKRDMKKEQALVANCQNAHYPDLYGHYREASFTQTKHHWWWKANRVFDQLEVTRHHTGLVLFLEEDHYVAEDFLHVLGTMQRMSPEACPSCSIFTLGNYHSTLKNRTSDKFDALSWIGNKHNMGMALNRSTWHEIKSCAKYFCDYDDYNWDWSLQHTIHTCLKNKLNVMVLKGPRVFHIGECGLHHSNGNCDLNYLLHRVKNEIEGAAECMFPEALNVGIKDLITVAKIKPNGGWSDPRDISLCLTMGQ